MYASKSYKKSISPSKEYLLDFPNINPYFRAKCTDCEPVIRPTPRPLGPASWGDSAEPGDCATSSERFRENKAQQSAGDNPKIYENGNPAGHFLPPELRKEVQSLSSKNGKSRQDAVAVVSIAIGNLNLKAWEVLAQGK